MQANYKNWVPMNMLLGFGAASAAMCIAGISLSSESSHNSAFRKYLPAALETGALGCAAAAGWCIYARNQFSYDGQRQLSKQIIDGVAQHIILPDGGVGLDVGCGSGALTIACAKRNPSSRMVGVDTWGVDYSSFNQALCEQNAFAEGAENVSFRKGDAHHLNFPDECFDAVTSNYVYHNIACADRQALLRETLRVLKKGGVFAIHDLMDSRRFGDMERFVDELLDEGYEDVRLIHTARGMFMTRAESRPLLLTSSTLLVGKK